MFCFKCKECIKWLINFYWYLKQPGFAYSVCGPFKKHKGRIEQFMKTGNTDFIYKMELDKACFQHDMAYGQ